MRDSYYIRNPYGSTAMDTYGRKYGDNTYREYERESYHPKDYVEQMQENYQIYKEQNKYVNRNTSMQSLNDTLESVVNIMAMLKKEARSSEERDLIKRYIVTINEL